MWFISLVILQYYRLFKYMSQGSVGKILALVYPCKWDIFMKVLLKCISYLILPFIYMLSIFTCLCLYMELNVMMCPDVVGCHMVDHMCIYMYLFNLLRPECMGTCYFKGGSMWHIWKFRGNFRYFSDVNKLGQYELLYIYWAIASPGYIPGGQHE